MNPWTHPSIEPTRAEARARDRALGVPPPPPGAGRAVAGLAVHALARVARGVWFALRVLWALARLVAPWLWIAAGAVALLVQAAAFAVAALILFAITIPVWIVVRTGPHF